MNSSWSSWSFDRNIDELFDDLERRNVSVFFQFFRKVVRRAVRFFILLINDYRVRVLRLTNRIKIIFRTAFRDNDTHQDFEDHIRDHLIHRALIRLLIHFVVSLVEVKSSLFDERNVDFEFLLWRVDACKENLIRILNRNFEYSFKNIVVYLRIDHRVVFFENFFDFFGFDSF